jgi:RNA polymerase sigma-70 factor, ECF subfamily
MPNAGIAGGDPQAHGHLRAELADAFASESGFRRWYDATLPRVYGYLLSRCADASLAEELTQTTYLEALRARGKYEGRSEVVTWLCGIARHHLADHYRRQERDVTRFHKLVRSLPEAAESGEWSGSEVRDSVARTLATLPPLQRLVLMLHYLDGLSVPETAKLAGKSVAATESLLARGRQSFRVGFPEVDDV